LSPLGDGDPVRPAAGRDCQRSAKQGGLIRLLAIVEPIELATDAGLMTPQ
jgi:hypothetical protein